MHFRISCVYSCLEAVCWHKAEPQNWFVKMLPTADSWTVFSYGWYWVDGVVCRTAWTFFFFFSISWYGLVSSIVQLLAFVWRKMKVIFLFLHNFGLGCYWAEIVHFDCKRTARLHFYQCKLGTFLPLSVPSTKELGEQGVEIFFIFSVSKSPRLTKTASTSSLNYQGWCYIIANENFMRVSSNDTLNYPGYFCEDLSPLLYCISIYKICCSVLLVLYLLCLVPLQDKGPWILKLAMLHLVLWLSFPPARVTKIIAAKHAVSRNNVTAVNVW